MLSERDSKMTVTKNLDHFHKRRRTSSRKGLEAPSARPESGGQVTGTLPGEARDPLAVTELALPSCPT